jgi:hypothetical protein
MCGEVKPRDQFRINPANGNPNGGCIPCVRERHRIRQNERWATDPEYRSKRLAITTQWAKDNPEKRAVIAKKRNQKAKKDSPDKVKARALLNQRVRFGRMPRASDCKCTHCENQAAHYHHYLGYAFEHRYDVQPVCIECHKTLG